MIESIKHPLENRIWFNYPGQPVSGGLGTAQNGTFDSPSNVGRVLDDGTTQLSHFAYNTAGNMTSSTDPAGRQTTLTYASNNIDIISVQQKTGSTTATVGQFGSYANHLPGTYTDAAGQIWKFTYNTAGQTTQVTDPLNQSIKYTYNSLGYLTTITNQNGQTAASYTYNKFGDIATSTDSEGYVVSYAYDAFDRVTEEKYPDGTTRKFAYTNLDMTSITDRQGRVTKLAYDALRNVISVTDPSNEITKFTYWENNSLKTITDGKGNVTSFGVDVESRPTAKTFADGTSFTNSYESTTNRIKSIQDPLSQIKQFSYTVDDQVAGITYQNAVHATPSVSYTYDPYWPRLTSMTDGTGTTKYTYQAPGALGALALSQITSPFNNDTISYQFDALGRVVQRRVGGNPETYTYDPLGRLVSHGNAVGEFALSYLGQTDQTTSLQGSGIGTQWTYDTNANDRRLLSISNGPNARSFGYSWTPEDDITKITETLGANAQSWTNTYDAADKLLTATLSTGATFGYTYDKANNITVLKSGSTTKNVTYNTLNAVAAFGGKAFTYDANGNLTKDDLRTYSWDAENRLIGVALIGQAGVTESFQYDGNDHRVVSTVQNGSTSTTMHALWCGETLCQERNERDKVLRRYYDEGEEAPAAGTVLYYGRDQLGTVRDVLSAQTGALVGSNDYDPYGNAIASSGQAATDITYAGLVTDPTSGLYFATNRQFDPRPGRWSSRSPSGEAGGVNLYAYVAGNPLRLDRPARPRPCAQEPDKTSAAA